MHGFGCLTRTGALQMRRVTVPTTETDAKAEEEEDEPAEAEGSKVNADVTVIFCAM